MSLRQLMLGGLAAAALVPMECMADPAASGGSPTSEGDQNNANGQGTGTTGQVFPINHVGVLNLTADSSQQNATASAVLNLNGAFSGTATTANFITLSGQVPLSSSTTYSNLARLDGLANSRALSLQYP